MNTEKRKIVSLEDLITYYNRDGLWVAKIPRPTVKTKNSCLATLLQEKFGACKFASLDAKNYFISGRGGTPEEAKKALFARIKDELVLKTETVSP